jgi:hypothetical protein
MSGESMLKRAAMIFTERSRAYGSPARTMEILAKRWSITLGHSVTPAQAALCLIDLKLTRLQHDPKHQDSATDLAGYAAVLHEVNQS